MTRELLWIVAGACLVVFQGTSLAQVDAKKAEAGAKAAGCLGCHTVEKKKVGPSLKSIAAKYKSANADKLVAALKANKDHDVKDVKDPDLKLISTWILSL